MSNNRWHKEVLKKYARKIISSAITYIALVLVFLLWHFILGIKFQWQQIAPLSQPNIFVRIFYSAFVFGTFGAFLHFIYFYKLLHDVVVKRFGLWRLYNSTKVIIWVFLMYISYLYVVPWLFNVLNTSISTLFNIANLILYLLPSVGIALILSIIYLIIKRYTNNYRNNA